MSNKLIRFRSNTAGVDVQCAQLKFANWSTSLQNILKTIKSVYNLNTIVDCFVNEAILRWFALLLVQILPIQILTKNDLSNMTSVRVAAESLQTNALKLFVCVAFVCFPVVQFTEAKGYTFENQYFWPTISSEFFFISSKFLLNWRLIQILVSTHLHAIFLTGALLLLNASSQF